MGTGVARSPLLVSNLVRLRSIRSPARRGFTLIELLTVITIIGILVALAAPSFVDQMRDRRVNEAALRIAGLYRIARTKALATGRASRFVWDPSVGARGYAWVETHPNPDPTCDLANWPAPVPTNNNAIGFFNASADVYQLASFGFSSPTGALASGGQVCFTPLGRAYMGTLVGPLTPLTGVGTMTVTNTKTNFPRRVYLPPSGAARVEL